MRLEGRGLGTTGQSRQAAGWAVPERTGRCVRGVVAQVASGPAAHLGRCHSVAAESGSRARFCISASRCAESAVQTVCCRKRAPGRNRSRWRTATARPATSSVRLPSTRAPSCLGPYCWWTMSWTPAGRLPLRPGNCVGGDAAQSGQSRSPTREAGCERRPLSEHACDFAADRAVDHRAGTAIVPQATRGRRVQPPRALAAGIAARTRRPSWGRCGNVAERVRTRLRSRPAQSSTRAGLPPQSSDGALAHARALGHQSRGC